MTSSTWTGGGTTFAGLRSARRKATILGVALDVEHHIVAPPGLHRTRVTWLGAVADDVGTVDPIGEWRRPLAQLSQVVVLICAWTLWSDRVHAPVVERFAAALTQVRKDQSIRCLRQRLQLIKAQPLQLLDFSLQPRLSGERERSREFALRDDGLIEAEQPRAAFTDPNRSAHRGCTTSPYLRPKTAGHFIESRRLQIAKFLRLFDGRLAGRRVRRRRPRAPCARRRRAVGQSRGASRVPSSIPRQSRDVRRSSRPGRVVRNGLDVARLWRCPSVDDCLGGAE